MTDIFTERRHILRLLGGDAVFFSNDADKLIFGNENKIFDLLQESGFSQLHSVIPERLQGKVPMHSPMIYALKEGRAACICLPAVADSPMRIQALTTEQCEYCDTNCAEYDVYYAALFYSGNMEERELELLGPVPVKFQGEWLYSKPCSNQYLPISAEEPPDRCRALFGGAEIFKTLQELCSTYSQGHNLADICIRNLRLNGTRAKTEFCALLDRFPPAIAWITQPSQHGRGYSFVRPFFIHCSEQLSELELLEHCGEETSADGLVKMMDATGHTLYAECLESLIYRPSIPTGCRYNCTLSMVAQQLVFAKPEIRITSGPAFEIHKYEYMQEHGCEPPEDFALCISMERMRILSQPKAGSFCNTAGKVICVKEAIVHDQDMHVITIRPIPDNDDVELHIFLSHEVMGPRIPQPGDIIDCMGHLFVSPDELLKDLPSWQDSVELAQDMEEREIKKARHDALDRFAQTSLAHGVAAAAFVGAGWRVEAESDATLFNRNYPLHATSQSGEEAVICVDCRIGRKRITSGYGSMKELHHRIKSVYGEQVSCFHCTVNLHYVEAADRYEVSMEMEPEAPGVENRLRYMACPFSEMEISINEHCEPCNRRLRPEMLDEAQVCKLFREALAAGKWADFALWVREEADYSSETVGCKLNSKLDFLRYLCEKIEFWKHSAGPTWDNFSVSTGSVMYQGERRHCTALHYLGVPTAITIFENKQGMVGHIHNLPWSAFCTYKQNTEDINRLRNPDAAPATPADIEPPPHMAEECDAAPDSYSPQLKHAAEQVLQYLRKQNKTAVWCSLQKQNCPHIWFRDTDGRLSWICLYPGDKWKTTLELPEACRLKKLRHYPGYTATVAPQDNTVRMEKVDWSAWINL